MRLTQGGRSADECWRNIPAHYPRAVVDEYVIMPNHFHGVILISDDDVGVQNLEPLQMGGTRENKFQQIIPKSLGSIVRGFKIGVTKWYRRNTDIYNVWQRGYFDRVIRDEDELNRVREYILQNPSKWAEDRENPATLRAVK
jgi:REP element-mobilizing transposase RayT